MRRHQRARPVHARTRPLGSALLAVVGLALVMSMTTTGPASADETPNTPTPSAAEDALARAESFTEGSLAASTDAHSGRTSILGTMLGRPPATPAKKRSRVDGTLVLRDLYRLSDDLEGDDQERAQQILARPTDKGADTYGDGYTTDSKVACTSVVCVHYVTTTADAPTDQAWVDKTLEVMTNVWRAEVGRLGYRSPLPDGKKGGDSRFDVYLKDLGSTGAYGYCTPEGNTKGNRFTASGYCVLDNDFSPQQFAGVAAAKSLRVTAAHEFFHAIQFAYDFGEDPWFMESTAVWMEERVAGGINDNRQYLPYGQLEEPGSPLDQFESGGFSQYGNWVWWEYLGQRFGKNIVRKVWNAAAAGGRKDAYSIRATRMVLARRGGLPAVFAAYAAATTDAPHAFEEGRSWPAATTAGSQVIGAGAPKVRVGATIDHLASSSYVFRPDPASVSSADWSLKLAVHGPRRSAAVALRITKVSGKVVSRTMALNARGVGSTQAPFGAGKIAQVTVTLANASTRYRCWKGSFAFSCQGKPLENQQPFRLQVKAFQR